MNLRPTLLSSSSPPFFFTSRPCACIIYQKSSFFYVFFNEFIGFFRLSLELFHLKFLVIELRVCENLFFLFYVSRIAKKRNEEICVSWWRDKVLPRISGNFVDFDTGMYDTLINIFTFRIKITDRGFGNWSFSRFEKEIHRKNPSVGKLNRLINNRNNWDESCSKSIGGTKGLENFQRPVHRFFPARFSSNSSVSPYLCHPCLISFRTRSPICHLIKRPAKKAG